MRLKLVGFFLVYLLSFNPVSAQTLEPSSTPTPTPTASADVSPTPSQSPTPPATSSPTPTSTPAQAQSSTGVISPTPTPTSTPGQVLSGATELGDTESGREFSKWLIALVVALASLGLGIKIAKNVTKADE